MTATDLTIKIAGTAYPVLNESWSFPDHIEQSSQCNFSIRDDNGTYGFQKGQLVTVEDTLEGRIYTGSVHTVKRSKEETTGSYVKHEIECVDLHAVLESTSFDKQYERQYMAAILFDQIKYLKYRGITANFAMDRDITQGDFVGGTHANTIATANVDDGCLELAPAGAVVTINLQSSSDWSAGTHANTDVVSGLLQPQASPAIRFETSCLIDSAGDTYNYVNICNDDGTTTLGTDYFVTYWVFLHPDNPEKKTALDITFTDGTTLRGNFTNRDLQNLSPAPSTDLAALATGQWYYREIKLSAFNGKTISHIDIAIEGDKTGTYIAWFKEIFIRDNPFNIVLTVFDGSLEYNQQMQAYGYDTPKVSVVSTYNIPYYGTQGEGSGPLTPNVTFWTSTSYSISSVNLYKDSFLSYQATVPSGTILKLKYTLDYPSSNTASVLCTNNAPLPSLPAGLNVSSRSIRLLALFYRDSSANPLASPEICPTVSSIRLVLNPSYVMAGKTDIETAYVQASDWTTGTTLSGTTTSFLSDKLLSLVGYNNAFSTSIGSKNTFGTSSPLSFVDNQRLALSIGTATTDTKVRLNDPGTYQNFVDEFDVYVSSSYVSSYVYRTTFWSNTNNTHGYNVDIRSDYLELGRGTNSSTSTYTQISHVGMTLGSGNWHRIKVDVSGNGHKVYLDGIKYIDVTDSTHTAAGNIGFRIWNNTGVAQTAYFRRFGIVGALTGTWTSGNIPLTSVGTYGAGYASWRDQRQDTSSTILVEVTANNGANWFTCTNGAILPVLTAGQSLSGVNLKFRVTLTATSTSGLSAIDNLLVRVLQQFSSSGTRISPALLLDSVGRVGSTLAAYEAIAPPGTSVVMALSLDGISYSNVTSGDPIPGITQQPDATIDSFNAITSSSYTGTARTGGAIAPWTWDTANSCLTVSGGTNALLVYGAISCKDADLIFDIDQADNCGVIWRWTDAGNYYELLTYDSSSSAGSTNAMKLFKIVANVKTQIGSNISATLIRGNKYRVRVTMIGTAIAVYLDGTSVRSTTDSALAGPGQCGLSNVSGNGRIYNLRIQPLGDDLTGKKVHPRLTLASTVATATPQVTSATVLATNPNIGIGALVDTADYRNTYLSDNIADLAKRSGYFWTVLAGGDLVCHKRETRPAPWVLTSNDVLVAGLEVAEESDLYRNKQTITGVIATLSTNETHNGDGKATSWPLKYNVVSVTSVTLNGQSVTFGAKGETGKSFYYEVGSNTLAQDVSGALLQQTDPLYIEYDGQYETSIVVDNLGQFPGTVSQWDYIIRSGITIPTPVILNQASAAQTANGTSGDLDVTLTKNITVDINITAHSGTNPTAQFFVDRKAPDGTYYPIWQSVVITASSAQISTSIGPNCAYRQSLGALVQLRWIIGGTSSPSKTFSVSIIGKLDVIAAGLGAVEAIEDVSGQNMSVADAEALADSRLQEHGVIGRILRFGTTRTGLAAGQSLNAHIPEHKIVDAETLITSVDRTQTLTVDSGQPSQFYWFKVVAVEGPALDSWSKAMNQALVKGGKA